MDSLYKTEKRLWRFAWSFSASFFILGDNSDLEMMLKTADARMYLDKAKKS